ncbi:MULTISPECIES: universal stress protein [unclassified Cupriavidus]|uniref:universal stress protein n=1 Tax=unclassified Cupriavidus TaxID=2640874 RepID=UPI0010566CC9|nr:MULTISPECIES: universal stress protein [unclassified Cupriavidus]MBF6989992.1 universal stress protein [Cupriavidus sp. IK-TO18]TDF67452.1 universal stress protein [Cupriavidus sp. L7L]
MTNVVLPCDGSDYSVAAARALLASGLFQRPLNVHLVHVLPEITGRPRAYLTREQMEQWASAAAQDAFTSILPLLQADHCAVTEHHCIGEPANEIVAVARNCRADVIVMGTHGHGAFLSAVMGSIAVRVVAAAPVPVVLVPRRSSL